MKLSIFKTMVIVVAVISLNAVQLYAQTPETLWTKTFDGCGYGPGYGVIQSPDGGFVIGTQGGYLVKIDPFGNEEWHNAFEGNCGSGFVAIHQASDGGYVLAGTTASFTNSSDIYLVKLNPQGNLEWQHNYGDTVCNEICTSCTPTNDGGFILLGHGGWVYGHNYLVKTDSLGNLQWEQRLALGYWTLDCRYVAQTTDGGYIMAGYCGPSPGSTWHILLVKTDALGNLQWQRTMGDFEDHACYCGQLTSDGGLILGGFANVTPMSGPWRWGYYLLKTDALGNPMWQHTYDFGSSWAYCLAVLQTADGGHIFSGLDVCSFPQDIHLVKTDALGFLQWQKTIGDPFRMEECWAIEQTADHGYILTGYSASTVDWNYDMYLVRLAAAELPPVADAGPDQSIHAGDTTCLDGGASFDDNTATDSLLYNWTLIAKPDGSNATLIGADTQTPSFVVDLPGTYVVSLVVTDEAGLVSDPDEVMISSENVPPFADAGADLGAYTGQTVQLDGTSSFDWDSDPLTFAWLITAAPEGSNVILYYEYTATPYFSPDLPGEYTIQLIVNDGFADSEPDQVVISVITAANFAENKIMEALNYVNTLPLASVTNKGNQTALGNFLTQAIAALQTGNIETAVNKLNMALERTDGCVLRGEPDGNGPGRDWIIDCPAQTYVYQLLTDALNAISQ